MKTPDAGVIQTGDTATFTILVSNTGTGSSNVSFDDQLPDGGLNWSTSTTGCTVTGSVGDQDLECAFALAAGASKEITVSSPTTNVPGACGVKPNTVTITASGDISPNNNTDNAQITVQCPDVSVLKTPDAGVIMNGETATFTILVTNSGTGSSNVSFDDQLPDGGLNWSTSTTGCTVMGSVGDQDLECAFALAAGASKEITVSSPTTNVPGACGVKPNTVTITASGDISPNNNTDNAQITVLCPDVSVSKTPDAGVIQTGDTATFTILVSNTGTGSSNVSFDDQLPDGGLNWSTSTTGCTVMGSVGNQDLECAFALAAGASKEITVSSPTTNLPGACGVKPNAVTITASGDITPNNNTDTAQITVQCPDVSVSKTPDAGVVQAGETATFTILVTNSGTSASNVSFDDQLPDGGLNWSTSTTGCTVVGPVGRPGSRVRVRPGGERVEGDHGLLADELGRRRLRHQAEHGDDHRVR